MTVSGLKYFVVPLGSRSLNEKTKLNLSYLKKPALSTQLMSHTALGPKGEFL